MPKERKTEHPHIVRTDGIVGGRPRIKGTRISVELIARFFKDGTTPQEILDTYPHLKAAAVYDAISYYLDHQEEIDAEIAEGSIERLKEKYGFEIDDRGFVRFKQDAR